MYIIVIFSVFNSRSYAKGSFFSSRSCAIPSTNRRSYAIVRPTVGLMHVPPVLKIKAQVLGFSQIKVNFNGTIYNEILHQMIQFYNISSLHHHFK